MVISVGAEEKKLLEIGVGVKNVVTTGANY